LRGGDVMALGRRSSKLAGPSPISLRGEHEAEKSDW
jgi:hypothetical protein